MITKLGGRKFLLSLIAIGVGTAIELTTTRGVTGSFAGLLGGIIAAFGATNFLTHKQYAAAAGSQIPVADPDNDSLLTEIKDLTSNLEKTILSIEQVKEATLAVAQTTQNTHKVLVGALGPNKNQG